MMNLIVPRECSDHNNKVAWTSSLNLSSSFHWRGQEDPSALDFLGKTGLSVCICPQVARESCKDGIFILAFIPFFYFNVLPHLRCMAPGILCMCPCFFLFVGLRGRGEWIKRET